MNLKAAAQFEQPLFFITKFFLAIHSLPEIPDF